MKFFVATRMARHLAQMAPIILLESGKLAPPAAAGWLRAWSLVNIQPYSKLHLPPPKFLDRLLGMNTSLGRVKS